MSLTSEGQMLYNLSQDILNRSEQIEDIMKELGVGGKKLRLGVPPMIGSLILPRIYGDFLQIYKDIEVEITDGALEKCNMSAQWTYSNVHRFAHDKYFWENVIIM